jgi:hypothetical protein
VGLPEEERYDEAYDDHDRPHAPESELPHGVEYREGSLHEAKPGVIPLNNQSKQIVDPAKVISVSSRRLPSYRLHYGVISQFPPAGPLKSSRGTAYSCPGAPPHEPGMLRL